MMIAILETAANLASECKLYQELKRKTVYYNWSLKWFMLIHWCHYWLVAIHTPLCADDKCTCVKATLCIYTSVETNNHQLHIIWKYDAVYKIRNIFPWQNLV